MVQGVVKPRISDSVYGKCHINLSSEDKETLESQPMAEVVVEEPAAVQSTEAADTDDEAETQAVAPVALAPKVEETVVKKMVVKKKVVTAAVAAK
jgi:hypothetical protein